MTKKLLFFLFPLIFFPFIVSAAGLVPCGGPGEDPCTLCHLFVLVDSIIDFLIFNLVPPIALLMIIIGALMLIFSMDNPQIVSTGKRILKSVVIGLVIIYASYSLVGWFLVSIGLADWVEDIYRSWWSDGTFVIICD